MKDWKQDLYMDSTLLALRSLPEHSYLFKPPNISGIVKKYHSSSKISLSILTSAQISEHRTMWPSLTVKWHQTNSYFLLCVHLSLLIFLTVNVGWCVIIFSVRLFPPTTTQHTLNGKWKYHPSKLNFASILPPGGLKNTPNGHMQLPIYLQCWPKWPFKWVVQFSGLTALYTQPGERKVNSMLRLRFIKHIKLSLTVSEMATTE